MAPAAVAAWITFSAHVLAQDVVAFSPEFWKVWGDGQAEVAAYDLTEPHYKAPRRGSAVTIFVSETFSNSARVKADPGKHPPADEFPVIKLNLVKDFQTGIYDYNDMTSVFVAAKAVNNRDAGSPTKISFSSQEWCGHVYHQLLFDAAVIRNTRHSYFDGEGDEQTQLPYPAKGLSADVLLHWARGMAGPQLKPGESREVDLLDSLQTNRDKHVRIAWNKAKLTRSAAAQKITVPAGTFEVEAFEVSSAAGKRTFYVEKASPRRIIRWEDSNGERAEMLRSARLKYWELNKPGGEAELKKLLLSPRPPRTT